MAFNEILKGLISNPVADYAAVLSTIVFFKPIYDRRPRVEVTIKLPYGNITNLDKLRGNLSIKAVNLSERSIHLSDYAAFILPDKQVINIYGGNEKRIDLDEPHTFNIAAYDFVKKINKAGFTGKVRLVAVCKDHRNRQFKSKATIFDTVMWEKQCYENQTKLNTKPAAHYNPSVYR